MPQATHVIRPAPGADGPFFVVSEGSTTTPPVQNVTLGLTFAAAMTQATTDGTAILAGATPIKTTIITQY